MYDDEGRWSCPDRGRSGWFDPAVDGGERLRGVMDDRWRPCCEYAAAESSPKGTVDVSGGEVGGDINGAEPT